MRAWFAVVFVAACGFPEPVGPPDAVFDAPIDEPVESTLALAEGTISTGGGALEAGALTVIDDGFERFETICAEALCVTGGVTP